LEYPEAALREAVLNAIVHKDYTSTTIQLSVYDNRLMLWNPGKLPADIPLEKLKEKHSSYPRNKHIAEIFFRAGYIESWGRGIEKIILACREVDLPEPVFEEAWGGIVVTFPKDIYTKEYFHKLSLNERQIKGMLYTKEKGQITNSEYQKINNIKQTASSEELQDLVKRKLLKMTGTKGRGAKYVLTT
jgi:ATP-dependent DNA helicase RecG